jgi:hypothetical protein
MHSCERYEECLSTFQSTITNQSKFSSEDITKSLKDIYHQIELDTVLLKTISIETNSVLESTSSHSLIYNAFLTALSGRAQKIKSLENELMTRIENITLLMIKDVWKLS